MLVKKKEVEKEQSTADKAKQIVEIESEKVQAKVDVIREKKAEADAEVDKV